MGRAPIFRWCIIGLCGVLMGLGCVDVTPDPLTPIPLNIDPGTWPPGASPTPSGIDTPTSTPGPSPTPSETASPGPTPTPTVTAPPTPTQEPTPTPPPADNDGDGFETPEDCDDSDPAVYPGAPEICGTPGDLPEDEDCDGETDEGIGAVYYIDGDGDGYGDATSGVRACAAPEGYISRGQDCDDDDASINPQTQWYPDTDGDGFGDPAGTPKSACRQPLGYTQDRTDCDDGDVAVSPAGQEVCDPEGVDEDCDGLEGDADDSLDPDSTTLYYLDADGDGYGDSNATAPACAAPEGYVPTPGDCAPSDDGIFPGRPEVCDGVDGDCDGAIDEGLATDAYYEDADGDGYGDPAAPAAVCGPVGGYVALDTDCDDGDADTFPGADERCDGLDNNCEGRIDEGLSAQAFYPDMDGDSHGAPGCTALACAPPPGWVASSDDCDGVNAASYPGAVELCDGQDNDCDGRFDEGVAQPEAGARIYWHADADGDGYGSLSQVRCEAQAGYVQTRGDCDDSRADVRPGAADAQGDGLDADCGGTDGPDPHVGFTGAPTGAALSAALGQASACQTVWVAPGSYGRPNLSISEGTRALRSTAYAQATILDGEDAGRLVAVSGGSLTLDGFALRNGRAPSGGASPGNGGAVLLVGGKGTFLNLSIPEGEATNYGGAMAFVGGQATVAGSDLEGGSAGASGGGIFLTNGILDLQNLRMEGNTAPTQGGQLHMASGLATLSGSHLEGGEADYGGAIHILAGALAVKDTAFLGNEADIGGAILVEGGTLSAEGGRFEGNTAGDGGGGGLAALRGAITLTESIFVENEAAGSGGGIFGQSPASFTLSGVVLEDNEAEGNGGGIALEAGSMTATGLSLIGNVATEDGGGLYLYGASGSLGRGLIAKNSAERGGGVALFGGTFPLSGLLIDANEASSKGGGIYSSAAGNLTLSQSTVIRNEASSGAGVYAGGTGTTVAFSNDILAFNLGHNAFIFQSGNTTTRATFNCLYNTGGEANHNIGSLGSTNTEVDPRFMSTPAGSEGWNVHLSLSSPLIDHGDNTKTDPDGSTSDMGIYGGQSAGSRDLDLDGVPDYFWPGALTSAPAGFDPGAYDCDDRDAAVQACP